MSSCTCQRAIKPATTSGEMLPSNELSLVMVLVVYVNGIPQRDSFIQVYIVGLHMLHVILVNTEIHRNTWQYSNTISIPRMYCQLTLISLTETWHQKFPGLKPVPGLCISIASLQLVTNIKAWEHSQRTTCLYFLIWSQCVYECFLVNSMLS